MNKIILFVFISNWLDSIQIKLVKFNLDLNNLLLALQVFKILFDFSFGKLAIGEFYL